MADFQLRALARRLAVLERDRLQRKLPSLAYSSIDDGALTVTDGDGTTTMVIGQQSDGTSTTTVIAGPPPPMPAGVSAEAFFDGALAAWDGTWVGGVAPPLDFARVEIHASQAGPDFVPDLVGSPSPTMVGSFSSVRGGRYSIGHLDATTPWYFCFVARSQSGKFSDPTPSVGPITPSKVESVDIGEAAITAYQLADNAVTSGKIAPLAVDSDNIADFAVAITKLKTTTHMIY